MTMKMTERDKKLLIFLCTALLLFLFGWVIIKPLMEKGLDIKEKTAEQEQLRSENEMKIERLAVLQTTVKTNEEKLEVLKEFFYPMMTSQEIDKIFTGAAMEKGLDVTRLHIDLVNEAQQVEPYVFSLQAQMQRMAESASQTQSASSSVDEIAEAELDGTSAVQTGSAGPFYIRQANVSLEVTGTRASLQALLDSISNEYQAVLMQSVQWTSEQSRSQGESMQAESGADLATLSLSMLLFMYQG